MVEPEPQYRLVIFDAIDDLPRVRTVFTRVTGVHRTDATQWLSKAPGVWPQTIPVEQVKPLLDGLYELAIAAEAWRLDAFPKLNPARHVNGIACQDDGFQITGLHGEPSQWIPWDKVILIDAGLVEPSEEFRSARPPGWVDAVSTGLNALIGRAPRAARGHPTRSGGRIDPSLVGSAILIRQDPLVAYRLIENLMHYRSLGRFRQPSAAENFPILLEQLYLGTNDAHITPGTHALVAYSPNQAEPDRDPESLPDVPVYRDTHALLEHATIQLLWSWYCRDRKRDLDEPPDPFETMHD